MVKPMLVPATMPSTPPRTGPCVPHPPLPPTSTDPRQAEPTSWAATRAEPTKPMLLLMARVTAARCDRRPRPSRVVALGVATAPSLPPPGQQQRATQPASLALLPLLPESEPSSPYAAATQAPYAHHALSPFRGATAPAPARPPSRSNPKTTKRTTTTEQPRTGQATTGAAAGTRSRAPSSCVPPAAAASTAEPSWHWAGAARRHGGPTATPGPARRTSEGTTGSNRRAPPTAAVPHARAVQTCGRHQQNRWTASGRPFQHLSPAPCCCLLPLACLASTEIATTRRGGREQGGPSPTTRAAQQTRSGSWVWWVGRR
ncbi:hypothetical protein BC828DRAFT_386206, partial [Blastocladiella britannica]